jgi:hypothetical protein
MLPGTPQGLLRPGSVARNGLSLARTGFRFRELHSEVNGPDLLLRFHAYRFDCPFDQKLCSSAGLPRLWPLRRFRPVAANFGWRDELLPAFTPLWGC